MGQKASASASVSWSTPPTTKSLRLRSASMLCWAWSAADCAPAGKDAPEGREAPERQHPSTARANRSLASVAGFHHPSSTKRASRIPVMVGSSATTSA